MKTFFRSNESGEDFRINGAITLPFLNDREMSLLDEHVDDYRRKFNGPGMKYSLMLYDAVTNIRIRDELRSILKDAYDRVFINFNSINESYLVKGANTTNQLAFHQDWNYTDPDEKMICNFWLPLSDSNNVNGGIFYLKGSHTFFNNVISGTYETARLDYDVFPKALVTEVKLKRGEALLFHPGLFHGSFSNRSNTDRYVVASTILHAQSRFKHFHKLNESEAVGYHLSENSFLMELESLSKGMKPSNRYQEEIRDYHHEMVTPEDILNHYDRHAEK